MANNSSSGTNVLMIVAVVAVAVSLIGVFSQFSTQHTGYAEFGNVTFQIESVIAINFTNSLINWSTGYVNTTGPAPCTGGGSFEAVLSTDTSKTGSFGSPVFCGVNWQQQNQGLTLQSDSNSDINVTLTSDIDANALIDGGLSLGSNFRWVVSNNETGTCNTAGAGHEIGLNPTTYTEIIQDAEVVVCDSMNYDQGANALDIDFELNISEASTVVGEREATITATAEKSFVQI